MCTSMLNVCQDQSHHVPIAYRQVARRGANGWRTFRSGRHDDVIAHNDPTVRSQSEKSATSCQPSPIRDIGRQGSYKAGSRKSSKVFGRMAACRSERLNGDSHEPLATRLLTWIGRHCPNVPPNNGFLSFASSRSRSPVDSPSAGEFRLRPVLHASEEWTVQISATRSMVIKVGTR